MSEQLNAFKKKLYQEWVKALELSIKRPGSEYVDLDVKDNVDEVLDKGLDKLIQECEDNNLDYIHSENKYAVETSCWDDAKSALRSEFVEYENSLEDSDWDLDTFYQETLQDFLVRLDEENSDLKYGHFELEYRWVGSVDLMFEIELPSNIFISSWYDDGDGVCLQLSPDLFYMMNFFRIDPTEFKRMYLDAHGSMHEDEFSEEYDAMAKKMESKWYSGEPVISTEKFFHWVIESIEKKEDFSGSFRVSCHLEGQEFKEYAQAMAYAEGNSSDKAVVAFYKSMILGIGTEFWCNNDQVSKPLVLEKPLVVNEVSRVSKDPYYTGSSDIAFPIVEQALKINKIKYGQAGSDSEKSELLKIAKGVEWTSESVKNLPEFINREELNIRAFNSKDLAPFNPDLLSFFKTEEGRFWKSDDKDATPAAMAVYNYEHTSSVKEKLGFIVSNNLPILEKNENGDCLASLLVKTMVGSTYFSKDFLDMVYPVLVSSFGERNNQGKNWLDIYVENSIGQMFAFEKEHRQEFLTILDSLGVNLSSNYTIKNVDTNGEEYSSYFGPLARMLKAEDDPIVEAQKLRESVFMKKTDVVKAKTKKVL